MKLITVVAALLPLASAAGYSKQEYDSGAVMAKMMAKKEVRPSLFLFSKTLIKSGCVGSAQGSRPLRQQEMEWLR